MSTYLVFGGTGNVGRRLVAGGAAVRATSRADSLTGPEALTQVEQVRMIGAAIGRPLRWQELSPAEERARLLADAGFPDDFVEELLAGYAAMAAAPPPTPTSMVEDITGAPATPLAAWAAEHAADFGGAAR
jgi:uncharacterized protein YbjT (DUF2867 family)